MNEENLNNVDNTQAPAEVPATPEVNLDMPTAEVTTPAPEMPAETPVEAAPAVETPAAPTVETPVAPTVETPATPEMPAEAPVTAEAAPAAPATEDKGSFGWAVLGFFFPLIGLILFLCWKNKKPKSAKKAGIGALVGFLLNVLSIVLVFLLFGAAAMAFFGAIEELNETGAFEITDDAYVEDYAIDDSAYDLNSDDYSVEVDEAFAEDTQVEATVEEVEVEDTADEANE